MLMKLFLWPFKLIGYMFKLMFQIIFWPLMFIIDLINGTSDK